MKAALFSGLGLVLAGIACNPEQSLSEVLHGKSCREENPQCVEPYVCNEQHICVMPFERLDTGGSSGNASDELSPAGAAGAPQEVSTNDRPFAGGEGGAAGSEMLGAGAGGVSSTDPAVGDADAGCTKVQIFIDRDGDGYGSAAVGDSKFDCLAPGWVTVGGDCFDAVPTPANHAEDVHPGQTGFFAVGYPLPDQLGGVSFDYDCSQQEEANSSKKAAGDCLSASLDTCFQAIGVEPTERSGPGVNNLCGSNSTQTCIPGATQCSLGPSGSTDPILCH